MVPNEINTPKNKKNNGRGVISSCATKCSKCGVDLGKITVQQLTEHRCKVTKYFDLIYIDFI